MPGLTLPTTPIHHLGYVVDDLERGIHETASRLGAGPFYVLRDVPLTGTTSAGAPAVFRHSAAFGQWGHLVIELMQVDRCEPARVAEAMEHVAPQLNHVSWAETSASLVSDALTDGGAPEFLRGSLDDISFVFHDARAVLGHNLEVHADTPGFRDFFTVVREGSRGWDGKDPVRELSAAGA